MPDRTAYSNGRLALQAFIVWLFFMIVNVIHHGTIQFILGSDMRGWVYSSLHLALSGFLVYGITFLVVPLILVKSWATVRRPMFLIPLALAVVSATLWSAVPGIGVLILFVLVFLHWRFDLADLGFRTSGCRGDAVAALMIAALYLLPRLLKPIAGLDIEAGVAAGLLRLFANPATTAEYFFYFGFLGTRLSRSVGSVPTALAIGVMYMLHEMTNPEYWYEGTQFALILVGVSIACAIYLWRRALAPIWLGDGLARAIGRMLA